MIKLDIPIKEDIIRSLHVGDSVSVSGIMLTGRDLAHKYMIEQNPDFLKSYLKDSVIYHCGPIVKKSNSHYEIVSAGPTTSIREEPYQYDIIKNYQLRGVLGKGGMKEKTLSACKEFGCVYLHAVGGSAVLLAQKIVKVKDVFMLEEFGIPEAFWVLEVKDFPAIVTMDTHGMSLHENILKDSLQKLEELLQK